MVEDGRIHGRKERNGKKRKREKGKENEKEGGVSRSSGVFLAGVEVAGDAGGDGGRRWGFGPLLEEKKKKEKRMKEKKGKRKEKEKGRRERVMVMGM